MLGFRDLVLFYVVTGISLRWIATAAAAGPSSIVIWIGAWLCFYTPLALSVLELSSRYPSEGGLYVWSKRAFGDFSGFMSAWTYWTSNLPYFPAVLYFAASNVLFMRQARGQHLSNNATFYIVFSLLTLSAATLLNIVGLDVGKWLHNVGALAMWIPVGIVIVMGLIAWHRFGSATSFTLHSMTPSMHLNDVIFWSVLTFAFGGMRDRVVHGRRNQESRGARFRWRCCSGGVTVTLCYILGTVCVLLALPSTEVSSLQGLVQAISKTRLARGFSWSVAGRRVSDRAQQHRRRRSLSCRGSAACRFVAGIDRFLPPAFGALHPRWKTPWVALLTQFVLGVVFIFLGQAGTSVKGAYDVSGQHGRDHLFHSLPVSVRCHDQVAARARRAGRDPRAGRKQVAKLVATLGFLTTTLTIALSLIPQPDEPNKPLALFKIVGGCAALVLVGVWIYARGKRRARTMWASRPRLSSDRRSCFERIVHLATQDNQPGFVRLDSRGARPYTGEPKMRSAHRLRGVLIS